MVDIVIVNWNSDELLAKCVQSVLNGRGASLVSKIFIIDNSSTDDSLLFLPKADKIELIKNKNNVGFAKACNQGFRLCSSPYVLLLNPDTQVYDDTLGDCCAFMEKENEVYILGCRLLDEAGHVTVSCARFPTPLRILYDAIGLSKLAPAVFTPATLMTDWDHRHSRYVDQVMGAFMFMRAGVFEKIGFFDERFFVYYEELDFSFRLHQAGGKTYFNTDIAAMHVGEGTTRAVKAFRLFLSLSSRLKYSKKHFSGMGYALVAACTYTAEFISRFFFLLFSGKPGELKDLGNAYRMMLRPPLTGV